MGLMTVLDSFSSHIPESEEEYIVKEEGRHSCTELALAPLLCLQDQIKYPRAAHGIVDVGISALLWQACVGLSDMPSGFSLIALVS